MKKLFLHLIVSPHNVPLTYEVDLEVSSMWLDLPEAGNLSITSINQDSHDISLGKETIYFGKPFFLQGYDADYVITSFMKEDNIDVIVKSIKIKEYIDDEIDKSVKSKEYDIDFKEDEFISSLCGFKIAIKNLKDNECDILIDNYKIGRLSLIHDIHYKDTVKYATGNTEDSVIEFGKHISFYLVKNYD